MNLRLLIEEVLGSTSKTHINEAFDSSMGGTRPLDSGKLIEYINRVITKKRTNKENPKKTSDYLTMPHIHASIANKVLVQTAEGETVDIDKFRQILMQRPDALLRQNEKMIKSRTFDTEFFNTSLPALKGLVVDEGTGEFKIVDTCPSAGNCQLVCYAKHGSYVLFPEVSISQNKALNYLFNDSDGFKRQLENEIVKVAKRFKGKKKVQIRWNDSGDLLSPKFFDIVMGIVNNTPMVDHYIYTKEVAMIKAYPNPPQNVIFNYSYGAKRDQEKLIDPVKDKVSYIVDTKDKIKEPVLSAIIRFKYIEKKGKNWEYNDSDATKQVIAQRYKLDPKTILTIDELSKTPEGASGQYNVIVLPGESDLSASRRDVRGTYLIIH
jgi:hypothetical protein